MLVLTQWITNELVYQKAPIILIGAFVVYIPRLSGQTQLKQSDNEKVF